MLDRGTTWTDCCPAASRTRVETLLAYQHFLGLKDKVVRFYSDAAGGLHPAAQELN